MTQCKNGHQTLIMETITAPATVAIILTDADRAILWVNDYFSKVTGFNVSEVKGKKPSVLQGEQSDQRLLTELRNCLDLEISSDKEFKESAKYGEPYSCRLVVHPVHDSAGEITNYIAFAIDATQVEGKSATELMHFSSKYQTSSLKGAKSLELYERLRGLMVAERLYLDPHLNLPQLAASLDTNTKYLSQVVNYHYGNNLQQFVNVYRVLEAKKQLVEGEHSNLTYYAIGQLCGFKNKSTFYKVFKKLTNVTPHELVLQSRHTRSAPEAAIEG